MLIDTHCHINDIDDFPNPVATIRDAKAAGIGRLVIIGVHLESSRRAIEIASANDGVFAAVGLHPNYTAKYEKKHAYALEPLLRHPKVVGFGEIGLDFYRETSSSDCQYAALRDQLELASSFDVPIIFHCRRAYPELLGILEERPQANPYLFHCFSGDEADLGRALAFDSYFGVDGPVTYKSAKDLRSVLSKIPIDRLVLETDSPYLPPEPHRGKANSPAYLRFINDALASTMGVSPEEMEKRTTATAEALFKI